MPFFQDNPGAVSIGKEMPGRAGHDTSDAVSSALVRLCETGILFKHTSEMRTFAYKSNLIVLIVTAFLHFRLPFSRFFKLFLNRSASTGMLEFYLRLHGPALSEVITQIDDSMRDIKASMLLSLVGCGRRISIYIVAIEIASQGYFAVTADGQTLSF